MLVSMMAGLVSVLAFGLNIEQMEITNRFGYEFYGRMERDTQNQYYGMDEFISPLTYIICYFTEFFHLPISRLCSLGGLMSHIYLLL